MNKVQTFVLLGFFALFLSGFFITQNLSMTSDGLPILAEPQVHEEFVISSGESWLSGWSYRQQITITGQTGAGTYYQIRLPFNYDAAGVTGEVNFSSHCQTDFGDIRLTDNDGDTELDYWIEEKTDSDDGLLWVEVADSLESGTVVIYIYYGTSGTSTTTSDGANTFLLFDDFDDGTIDTDIWTVYAGDLTETGGNLVYTGTTGTAGSLISDTAFSTGIASRTRAWGSNDDLNSARIFGSFVKSATDFGETADQWSANVNDRIDGRTRTGGSSYNTFALVVSDYTTAYVYELQWASTVVNFIQGTSTYKTASSNLPTGDMIIYQNEAYSAGDVGYQDWFLIRKFVATEPSVSSISLEETIPNYSPIVDDVSIVDFDDTDNLYVGREYTFTMNVSDANGYSNIMYAYCGIVYDSGVWPLMWVLKYDVLVDSFSEFDSQGYIEINSADCDAVGSGDDLDITFKFSVTFSHPEYVDYDIKGYVYDVGGLTHNKFENTNLDVITKFDLSSFSLDDGSGTSDRGDYNTVGGITASGTVVYYGSTIFPASDLVDVWVTCSDIGQWVDTTLSSGGFSMVVDSDDVVGIDTYNFLVVLEGQSYSSTNRLHTTHTDTYIADRILFVCTTTDNFVGVGDTVTVTQTAIYDYDDSAYTGSVTWSNSTVGSVTNDYAIGRIDWTVTAFTDTTHGITSFTNTSAYTNWNGFGLTSSAYYWVQYSPNQVWLIWNPSTVTFDSDDSAVGAGFKIQSYMNGTSNDWAITDATGQVGVLSIGSFTSAWYHVNITVTVIYDGVEDVIFQRILSVDILHSIHIEDSLVYLSDDYVTFGIQTNWNNATYYVWDNITGTPEYIGGSVEGWYQIPKSSTVGVHQLIILVNGTQGTVDNSAQTATGSSTDTWEYLRFTYTVNAEVLYVTDTLYSENDIRCYISGFINKASNWYLYVNESGADSGAIASAGSFQINWDKSTTPAFYEWAVKFTDGTTNRWINGSYYVDYGSAMALTSFGISTDGSFVTAYAATNWLNATLYLFENDVQKDTDVEGGLLVYTKSVVAGEYTVGLKIISGTSIIWYNVSYIVASQAVMYAIAVDINTNGAIVYGYATTNWYNATLTLYENDIQKDTDDEGKLLSYTKSTTTGEYNVALKISSGVSILWYNVSYTISTITFDPLLIEDSVIDLNDNWVTIGIRTNWDNTTFYIWDNSTYVGGSYEGWYQFAKSTVTGLHVLIILINGTQGTIDVSSQDSSGSDSDSWEFFTFQYTVNAVTFSITDPFCTQNNESIVFSAIFYTGDLTIDYTIYEDGVAIDTGVLNIPSSGSFYVIKWDKSSSTSVAQWSVSLMAGGTNITVYGYNVIIDNSNYSWISSGYFEGDTVIVGESPEVAAYRAQDSMWDTVGTIMLLITMPVVVGIALKVDRAKSHPRGKRDKSNDGML